LPHQTTETTVILKMDSEQQELYDLVKQWTEN